MQLPFDMNLVFIGFRSDDTVIFSKVRKLEEAVKARKSSIQQTNQLFEHLSTSPHFILSETQWDEVATILKSNGAHEFVDKLYLSNSKYERTVELLLKHKVAMEFGNWLMTQHQQGFAVTKFWIARD